MFNSLLAHYSIALSANINHIVAAKFSSICPFIMVSEFPRSGGNWIRDMLGDCLQIPVPRFSKFPITFSALAHSHFPTPITKTTAVYILRDGRDVFVSHYWKSVNGVISNNSAIKKSILSKHPCLKSVINKSDVNHTQLMSIFYDEWKIRPMGSKLNWGDHVNRWLNCDAPSLVIIKYEDMRINPHQSLFESIKKLTNKDIDSDTIEFVIQRNSFKSKTGRLNGEVDNKSNRRRGIVGDWKNVFTEELLKKFHSDFSEALALGGYN